MADFKSDLQIKVLGLKRGYTAKDIKYNTARAKRGKWQASLHIYNLKFPITAVFNSKKEAEASAAKDVLDHWSKVKKMLKQKKEKKHTKRPKRMPWDYVSDEDDEEDHGEKMRNNILFLKEYEPTKAQCELAGRHLYAAMQALQEKKI